MRFLLRFVLVGICCVAIALGVVAWITGLDWWGKSPQSVQGDSEASPPAAKTHLETFPDPNAPGTSAQVYLETTDLDGDIFTAALPFTGAIRDPRSLEDLREARRGRGRRGITALRAQYDQLHLNSPPTFEQVLKAVPLARQIAFLYMYEGRLSDATSWLERALDFSRRPEFSPDIQAHIHALLGIAALRRGEIENCLECLGPSSCILPLEPDAVHTQQAGSREAVKQFIAYLKWSPGDLRVRWLLNIAYMTLGEYPKRVPPGFLIPPDSFRSKLDVGRFENIAPRAGLGVRGPNLAGGSIFDDFNGDGLPDLLTTSIDSDLGASLFINRADGTFEDRSAAAGLSQQIYALNLARADFDNDGNPDIVLLRGAWEKPARLSLLRNKGGGIFEDVTIASGLGEPIATESAVWGDYDNDGRLDLFVCGEFHSDAPNPSDRSRLYHNQGDGTFKDVAAAAGIVNERVAKGSAWGDYDGDGRLDLFVSNLDGPCRLYHNDGNGAFHDVASQLGVAGPSHEHSFACWFWDFDNDGRLDLFVNDYNTPGADIVAHYLGLKGKDPSHPRLYRNLGDQGFRDVSLEAGLDWPIAAMGANFGDIDNDGYLDAYFGTGWMSYSGLVPNVMLKNVEGRRFEDVTESSRTGHLQKGHGVSFADWDCDGDLDLFVVLGGAYPGDQAYNILFQNPGHGRHWLKVKLVGTKTNRSALGARIQVELKGADGTPRSIFRVIGNNGSFGGNSLVETIGLADARSVVRLTVTWPTSKTSQTFRDVAADQAIEVTEGSESFKVLHQPRLPSPPPVVQSRTTDAPGSR
ncbi:MAG: FG-GAP-like repeat-containing protein [Isosphaerales bacterium]